MKLPQDYERSA